MQIKQYNYIVRSYCRQAAFPCFLSRIPQFKTPFIISAPTGHKWGAVNHEGPLMDGSNTRRRPS